MTTLVTDDFARADGTGLGTATTGQTWAGDAASWTIVSQRAKRPSAAGYSAAVIDANATAVEVTVTVYPDTGADDLGLMARYVDSGNHILFDLSMSGGTWVCRAFEKVGGGSYTGVTTLVNPMPGLSASASPFKIRIRCLGSAGEVFATTQADLTTFASMGTWTINSGLLAGTLHGFTANDTPAAAFDDLAINGITVNGVGASTLSFSGTSTGLVTVLGTGAATMSFSGSGTGEVSTPAIGLPGRGSGPSSATLLGAADAADALVGAVASTSTGILGRAT